MCWVHTEMALHPGTLVLLELCDSIAQKSDYYFLLGQKRRGALESKLSPVFLEQCPHGLYWGWGTTHRVDNTSFLQLNGENARFLFVGVRKIKAYVRQKAIHLSSLNRTLHTNSWSLHQNRAHLRLRTFWNLKDSQRQLYYHGEFSESLF